VELLTTTILITYKFSNPVEFNPGFSQKRISGNLNQSKMKGLNINIIPVFLTLIFLCIFFSCSNNPVADNATIKIDDTIKANKAKTGLHKPGCTYQDTLIIDVPSAVFYYPDSLQLEKIKQLTDSVVYIGSMHEYFYMMQNARAVIKKEWPNLKIKDAKNCRYLLFRKKDGARECIDLDRYDNIYGLFVFDGKKAPGLIDMMNIDTQVSFYLNP
jgi:hypothetical protein